MKNVISLINEKGYAETMQNEIEPYLAKIRTEGYFSSFDGNNIHYEFHKTENGFKLWFNLPVQARNGSC